MEGGTYGEAFAVVVQSAVVLEECQYGCLVSGMLEGPTIMSSWRFDSCVCGFVAG